MVSGRNLGRFEPNSDAGADPRDEFQRVHLIKLLDDVAAKQVARAPRRQTPSTDLLGIAPHQIAHRAVVRHFLFSIYCADLVQRVDRWTQPTVHAEDLVVDNC